MAAGLVLQYIQPGFILTDGGIFSAIAYKDLNGGTLYVDAWENKPPGIFYLLECFMLIIPNPVYAVFILVFFALIGIGILTYIYLFECFKSLLLTVLIMGLALFYILNKNVTGDGLYTEIYGTLPILGALVILKIHETSLKKWHIILSHILFGLAFWFKEPFFLLSIIGFFKLQFHSVSRLNWIKALSFFFIPSLFFVLLMAVQGELPAFIEMIKYNITYVSSETVVSAKVKLNEFYNQLLHPLIPLILISTYALYKAIKDKTSRMNALFILVLWIASSVFIFISPYNFGHYYFPLYVCTFLLIGETYALMKEKAVLFKTPFIILSIYTIYQFDQENKFKLVYSIQPYQEDKLIRILKKDKTKTLFVDYVNRGDLYIKAEKVPVTFVPVALPVHFQSNDIGKANRDRIWHDLEEKKPDYVITTFTTAYFSWFLPNSPYYENNYNKIDSLTYPNENILILWKRKTSLNDSNKIH